MRIAYMATGYPYPSHTFIQNEVRALRALGLDITTFVHRRATSDDILSAADREAFETTFAIRPLRVLTYLRAHGSALAGDPAAYLRTLRAAVGLRGEGPRSLLWQLFYFGQAVVLWHRCRAARLRHIHAHFANVASDVTMLAVELGGDGWSWSFTMHGPTEFYEVGRFRLAQKVDRAAFVVSISHFTRSQLMGLVDPEHWPKLHVIRCGVDVGALQGGDARPNGGDAVRIVCVARLVPVKGQLVLLEALAELARRGTNARVELIGGGPMRRTLEDAVRDLGLDDRVAIAGALAHPSVLERVRSADILCLPSFAEGVPVVLMEAMALGRPVVTTQVMGIPELVEDEVSGLLVAPGSAGELASALERVIEDPVLRLRLGRAARERVRAEYDLHASARQLRDLFERELSTAA